MRLSASVLVVSATLAMAASTSGCLDARAAPVRPTLSPAEVELDLHLQDVVAARLAAMQRTAAVPTVVSIAR